MCLPFSLTGSYGSNPTVRQLDKLGRISNVRKEQGSQSVQQIISLVETLL